MDFNVVILTPTTGFPKAGYAGSIAKLLLRFPFERVFGDSGKQMIAYDILESSQISQARESMVSDWIAKWPEVTHFCYIDEDMRFEPDAFYSLARRRRPIVGTNYPHRIKGKGFTATTPDYKNRIQTTSESSGLEPCGYTGFGLCLIEKKVFETLAKPWFAVPYDREKSAYGTEDAWFGYLAKQAGIPWYVDHDASKQLHHVGTYEYCWDEVGQWPSHGN